MLLLIWWEWSLTPQNVVLRLTLAICLVSSILVFFFVAVSLCLCRHLLPDRQRNDHAKKQKEKKEGKTKPNDGMDKIDALFADKKRASEGSQVWNEPTGGEETARKEEICIITSGRYVNQCLYNESYLP
jgi:hypothetical protein